MSRGNLFGIACKTCRRRGRKCDRRLPTCMNCSLRGTECEGYVLRWVNAAVEKESSTDQTLGSLDHETNVLLTPNMRHSTKAKGTKTRRVTSSAHSRRLTRSAWNTEPQVHEHVARSNRPMMQVTTSRGFYERQQQNWIIPTIKMMAPDDFEDLIRYCTKIPRSRADEVLLTISQTPMRSVQHSTSATVQLKRLADIIFYP